MHKLFTFKIIFSWANNSWYEFNVLAAFFFLIKVELYILSHTEY